MSNPRGGKERKQRIPRRDAIKSSQSLKTKHSPFEKEKKLEID